MNSNNKQIRDVADIAAQIMFGQQPVTEKLHPNQQKLDVHEPEKDELTSDDFKKLRGKKGGVVKEDDTGYQDRFAVKNGKAVKHNPEKGEHDEPHHVWADSPEHAVRKHAIMNKPKTEEVAEGFKFNSHERGAAERLKDMRKNEKEAEKMDKQYSAMRKKREQDKLKKEEVEQIDELSTSTLKSYISGAQKDRDSQSDSKNSGDREEAAYAKKQIVKRTSGIVDAKSRMNKEEVELDEVKMADLPSTKVQGRAYGASKPEPHPLDVMKGPTEKQLLGVKSEKKKKFSEMVNLYQDGGMKSFMEALSKEEEDEIIDEVSKEIADYTMDVIDAGEYTEVTIGEEASQDEFNAEIEKAKAKSQGKDKAEVAKAAVQAVQQEEVDMNSAEMKKREKIVKGMKKGMEGFKERYGARAKNVMYATATKRAMEK